MTTDIYAYLTANLVVAALGIVQVGAAAVEIAETESGLWLVLVHAQRARQPHGSFLELTRVATHHAQAQVACEINTLGEHRVVPTWKITAKTTYIP